MFSRKNFFQHLKTSEINSQCRRCPSECDSTSYQASTYYQLIYNDQLNCSKDHAHNNFFSEGELKIKIAQQIQEISEEIDYPLLELSSEFIGILGTYLGVSFCTFAELFGFFYILYTSYNEEKHEHRYDLSFAAENGDPDPSTAISSMKSHKSSTKSLNCNLSRKIDNISLVKQRSIEDVA